MKTKNIVIVLMLSMIMANVWAVRTKGYIQIIKEIHLAPDHSKISEIAITETFAPGFYSKQIDTTTNYYVSERARPHLTQESAERLVKNGVIWLEDILTPRWTHLFGEQEYARHWLVLNENMALSKVTGMEYCPADKDWIYFCLIVSPLLILLVIILCWRGITLVKIKELRWMITAIFVTAIIASLTASKATVFDITVVSFICTFPSFLTTFMFKKRIILNRPLHKFSDGNIVIETGIVSSGGSFVYWLDKKFNPIESVWDVTYGIHNGLRIVSKNGSGDGANLFGIVDYEMNIVLPIKYSMIKYIGEALAAVEDNGVWGCYHLSFHRLVIPFKYESISDFKDGRALVQERTDNYPDGCYYIDPEGKQVPMEQLTEKEKLLLPVQ